MACILGLGKAAEANLRTAFAGESHANRNYLAFAQKAEQEGLPPERRESPMKNRTIHHISEAPPVKLVCWRSLTNDAAERSKDHDAAEWWSIDDAEEWSKDHHSATSSMDHALSSQQENRLSD